MKREQGEERLQSFIKLVKIFYRTAPSSLLTTFPPWNDKKGMSLRGNEVAVAIPY